LTARLENTVLSDKMIEEDLSQVEERATKSTYRLGVGLERCEDKGEKSAPKFIPSSTYHKEKAKIKPTKAHYPSNPRPSFKLREEAFVCMFCGRAGHLDEFCFRRKKIEKRHFEYTRNTYRDEFFDFPPRSYSRASPHTSSHAFPLFSYGPNHRHMVLVHERTALRIDALVMAHVLIVVIVPHVGPVFLQEGFAPILSQDTWTVHTFPLIQMVMCKRL
jgi:hypothetical protein